ncbi:MAG: alcohol dehydrogenase catalytic domain-containing protein [Acidobacteriota bacterium]
MRQLNFIEPGKLEWYEVEEPKLQTAQDAIVRPIAVARCDLDFAIIHGKAPFIGPFPLGHEFVGEIVEVGEEVTNFHLGQRVVVPFQIACGECLHCQRHLTASCTSVTNRSMYGLGALGGDWGGALSDLVRVPFAQHMLVEVPKDIDPSVFASVSDNIPDGWRTVGPYLEDSPDKSVLVVGGGAWSISLYAVAIARALGARQVDYADNDATRLALAESLGAKVIEGEIKRRLGSYDITVDGSANPKGLACALRSTAVGGVCTSVGIYYTDMTPIPLLEMYDTGITFKTGRADARPYIPKIIELIKNGKLHPEQITTRVATWDEAIEALPEPCTKVIITR